MPRRERCPPTGGPVREQVGAAVLRDESSFLDGLAVVDERGADAAAESDAQGALVPGRGSGGVLTDTEGIRVVGEPQRARLGGQAVLQFGAEVDPLNDSNLSTPWTRPIPVS